MISITEREKEIISSKLPELHIRRTVKQKSKRHCYYMEESREAMKLLKSLRRAKKKGDDLGQVSQKNKRD